MYFLGIDPGQSGGIALVGSLGQEPRAQAWKMPETERDIANLFFRIKYEYSLQGRWQAAIEKVHAMPKQGVSSTFKFGLNYGFLRASLIWVRVPFKEVSPNVWQKALGCQTKGDKNVSKAKAQQIFPNLKITHAISDALLIAEYARITAKIDPWDEI